MYSSVERTYSSSARMNSIFRYQDGLWQFNQLHFSFLTPRCIFRNANVGHVTVCTTANRTPHPVDQTIHIPGSQSNTNHINIPASIVSGRGRAGTASSRTLIPLEPYVRRTSQWREILSSLTNRNKWRAQVQRPQSTM